MTVPPRSLPGAPWSAESSTTTFGPAYQAPPLFRNRRRVAVSEDPVQIGIDYVAVSKAPIARQWVLALHFIPAAPGVEKRVIPDPLPAPDDVAIAGWAPSAGADVRVLAVRHDDQSDDVILVQIAYADDTIQGRRDAPIYHLMLTRVPHLDPFFNGVTFSFAEELFVEEAPLRSGAVAPSDDGAPINYLAKDFLTFRQLMLDRLSLLIPGWSESNPADLSITLVELLAYAGDQLSYFQDAVATEGYLGTARRRISVRRHARLLGYSIHEGCNARAWVHVRVKEDVALPRGTLVLTRTWMSPDGAAGGSTPGPRLPLHSPQLDYDRYLEAVSHGAEVFATQADASLSPAYNELQLYGWGAQEFSLPAGATGASFLNEYPDREITLRPGDVLVFQQVRSITSSQFVDPTRRHAVRLTAVESDTDPLGGKLGPGGEREVIPLIDVAWEQADALPFTLPVSAYVNDVFESRLTVALGNIVLADHGRPVPEQPGLRGEALPVVPPTGRYRPRLTERDLTYSVPMDDGQRTEPAVRALHQDPAKALPTLQLQATTPTDPTPLDWTVQPDLLASSWDSRSFVVEMENDRVSYLRFGDDMYGERPRPDTAFLARYRVGNGIAGNVGSHTITRFYIPEAQDADGQPVVIPYPQVESLTNPLPAAGGTEPEHLAAVRENAPQAYATQERCITDEDYRAVALRHSGVRKANASRTWTGSWMTVVVAVLRERDLPIDAAFTAAVADSMRGFLSVGADVKVVPPRLVPLEIELAVTLLPGYLRGSVSASLLQAFSDGDLPNGERGFFHTANLDFGQPVYLSRVITRARQVPGVAAVEATRFQRWHEPPRGELERGVIPIGPTEIARLDNNPDAPELGQITFTLRSAP
jgi:hypothetical protein